MVNFSRFSILRMCYKVNFSHYSQSGPKEWIIISFIHFWHWKVHFQIKLAGLSVIGYLSVSIVISSFFYFKEKWGRNESIWKTKNYMAREKNNQFINFRFGCTLSLFNIFSGCYKILMVIVVSNFSFWLFWSSWSKNWEQCFNQFSSPLQV